MLITVSGSKVAGCPKLYKSSLDKHFLTTKTVLFAGTLAEKSDVDGDTDTGL